MSRYLTLAYGLSVYALFLCCLLYLAAFVGGLPVPRGIDRGGPSAPPATAAAVDALLLSAFGLVHSLTARPRWKAVWARLVPAAAERSTFVLVTCSSLGAIFWLWHPIPEVLWSVDGFAAIALETLSWLGWVVVLLASFLIDHFRLFGVRQVVDAFRGRATDDPEELHEPFLYRFVRHPIMLGFLVAFWSASEMTVGHALFAAVMTCYVLVAVRLEERGLVPCARRIRHGGCAEYSRRVPMLLPLPRRRASTRGKREEGRASPGQR